MNGHLPCAVDTETSGLDPKKNDIIQIAIIPLAPDFEVSKKHTAFTVLLKPKRPENVSPDLPRKMKNKFLDACINGMDPWTAVDRFEEWFQKLHLPPRKKIVPVGSNFSFDQAFLTEWLGGPLNYENYLRSDYRDTHLTALYINDSCDRVNAKIPFPKTNLQYLCACLGLEHPNAHDAIADAFMAAKVYKKLLNWWDHARVIG